MNAREAGKKITLWEYYVVGKSDWKRYKRILFVESDRPTFIFIDAKGTEPSKRSYRNKVKVVLLDNKNWIINGKMHAHVRVGSESGFLPITKLGKPTKNTTVKENIAMNRLDNEIKERMTGGEGVCIIVKSGGKVAQIYHDCVGAIDIPGLLKADFAIINSKRKRVAYISHKAGTTAREYQQYVSLTGRQKDPVNQHPIVQTFLRRMILNLDDVREKRFRYKYTIPLETNAGRTLATSAIFGNEYGKNTFSIDNINFIGQGRPVLLEADPKDRPAGCGIVYELQFIGGLSVSGDMKHFKHGGYEPIISARFSNERKFYVSGKEYKDIRILISPKALMPVAIEMKV